MWRSMADQRKVQVLDSYQTLKAIRTAADTTVAPTAGPPLPQRPRKKTVPTKQVIICYECGYTFQLHGRAKHVPCSKCRADLDLTDHVITGKWSQSLKTAASILIKPDGIVQSGDLVGKHIILDGKLEAGTLRALEGLELGPRAEFREEALQTPSLKIGGGADITLHHPATYRELEILGALHATVQITGRVFIHAGGLLEGQLTAAHLQVETGGGLLAQVNVTA